MDSQAPWSHNPLPAHLRAVGPWGQLDAWTLRGLEGRAKTYAVSSDIWIHANGQAYYMQCGSWAGLVAYPGPVCSCRDFAAEGSCIHAQVASQLHEAHGPPSQVVDAFWMQEWGPDRAVTPRVGKWIIEVPARELDQAWYCLLGSLESGHLGPSIKARTAVPHPFLGNDTKVICVYTKDSQDEADKDRVRRELHRLGFKQHLRYKTDEETMKSAP